MTFLTWFVIPRSNVSFAWESYWALCPKITSFIMLPCSFNADRNIKGLHHSICDQWPSTLPVTSDHPFYLQVTFDFKPITHQILTSRRLNLHLSMVFISYSTNQLTFGLLPVSLGCRFWVSNVAFTLLDCRFFCLGLNIHWPSSTFLFPACIYHFILFFWNIGVAGYLFMSYIHLWTMAWHCLL